MKHFAIISIFILLMTGCRETLGPAGLVVSESEISCQAEGGEFLIEIEGRPDWTTDNTADWISVRRINGKHKGSISLIARFCHDILDSIRVSFGNK